MQLLTFLGVILLVALAQGVGLSDYLKFIPKFGGNVGRVVDSHHEAKWPFRGSSQASWPPKFCHDLSCPKYEVIRKEDQYEVRQYERSQWVRTNVAGMEYGEASTVDFDRLFKYISGDNLPGKKVDMTAPVITEIIPGQGPACESNFTMSFFVAPDAGTPPQPKDKKVFLQTFKPFRAYVRSFPGYIMRDIKPWLKEAAILAQALNNASITYQTDYYYIAGYDSPFRPFFRHNEVWFLA